MELLKEIDTIIEEVKDEANNFKAAESHAEEVEALKEMLDALMRGAHQVQEKIDHAKQNAPRQREEKWDEEWARGAEGEVEPVDGVKQRHLRCVLGGEVDA